MEPKRRSSRDIEDDDVFSGNGFGPNVRVSRAALGRQGYRGLQVPYGWGRRRASASGRAVSADTGYDECDRRGHVASPLEASGMINGHRLKRCLGIATFVSGRF